MGSGFPRNTSPVIGLPSIARFAAEVLSIPTSVFLLPFKESLSAIFYFVMCRIYPFGAPKLGHNTVL